VTPAADPATHPQGGTRRGGRAAPTRTPQPGPSALPQGLRLSALLLTAVVVTLRPLFAGTPSDFALTIVVGALLVLALGLTVFSRALEGRLPVVVTPLHLPMVLFALAALWGVARGGWQPEALLRGLDYLSLLLLVVLVAELGREVRERQLFLFLLLSSFFVVVVYGLYQFFYEFDQMAEQIARNARQVQLELGISPEDWPDFLARFQAREVYATFLMSNSLAGYLILLLPVLAGYLFDYVRATRATAERTSGTAYLVMLVAAAATLWLTRSRGAWLALAGALLVGVPALLLWPRVKRLWPLFLAGVVIAGGLGCRWLAQADVSARVLKNDSLGARLGFWQGALRVIERHPFAGVGIGRFQPHYLQVKLPSAHEVDLPHNLWLEVWVEMGMVGLVAVLWWAAAAVGLALSRARGGSAEERLDGRAESRPAEARGKTCLIAVMAGGAAFLVLWWAGGGWTGLLGWALAGLWTATALFFIYSAPERLLVEAGTGVRWGLVVGLAAFLLHASVDIDFYAPAIPASLVVLLVGVLGEPRGKVPQVRLGRWSSAGLGALALAAVVGYAHGVAQPLLETQSEKGLATQYLRRGEVREAVSLLEQVLARNPADLEALRESAGIYSGRFAQSTGTEEDFRRAEALWLRFISLLPESVEGHYQLARLYRDRALKSDPTGRSSEARGWLRRAEEAYRRAVSRYPTWPLLRVELGGVYEILGKPEQAAEEYREALRLSPLITQHVRRLTPEQESRLRRRLERLTEGRSGDLG